MELSPELSVVLLIEKMKCRGFKSMPLDVEDTTSLSRAWYFWKSYDLYPLYLYVNPFCKDCLYFYALLTWLTASANVHVLFEYVIRHWTLSKRGNVNWLVCQHPCDHHMLWSFSDTCQAKFWGMRNGIKNTQPFVALQYRHLISSPVDRSSAIAWLYKHPWITCQKIRQAHQWLT